MDLKVQGINKSVNLVYIFGCMKVTIALSVEVVKYMSFILTSVVVGNVRICCTS